IFIVHGFRTYLVVPKPAKPRVDTPTKLKHLVRRLAPHLIISLGVMVGVGSLAIWASEKVDQCNARVNLVLKEDPSELLPPDLRLLGSTQDFLFATTVTEKRRHVSVIEHKDYVVPTERVNFLIYSDTDHWPWFCWFLK